MMRFPARLFAGVRPSGGRRSVQSLWTGRVLLTGLLVCGLLVSVPRAQDRVILQPLNAGSGTLAVSGSIEEFSGERIVVRDPDGKQVRILLPDQYRLVEVETRHSPEYDAGLKAFQAAKYDEARRQWEQAVSKEDRRWMRREILAWLVRSALAQEDLTTAGNRCLKILESDPKSPHLSLLPLKWWPGDVTPAPVLNQAAGWLAEEAEPARLLGASWLLDDARRSPQAKTTLTELSRSTDARIRAWATMQLWRITLQEKTPGELQLQGWQQQWKELPSELRGGPALLLGHALSRRKEFDLAAVAFLWPGLLEADRPQLATRGLLEAAQCLAQVGQVESAIQLAEELRTRFPNSPLATEAQGQLAGWNTQLLNP